MQAGLFNLIITMEEKRMNEIGLELMSSSELGIRGGTTGEIVRRILEITVAVCAFVKNYWSSIVKGYHDGYTYAN
jgi:hypothetical protein